MCHASKFLCACCQSCKKAWNQNNENFAVTRISAKNHLYTNGSSLLWVMVGLNRSSFHIVGRCSIAKPHSTPLKFDFEVDC